MIALTSISPNHNAGDVQSVAVKSWLSLGLKVVSLNSKAEIEILKPNYPNVEFVPCRTAEAMYKRSYAPLTAFIELAESRSYESIMIINSDIEIRSDAETIKRYFKESENGLIISNRHDHNGDHTNPQRYDYGFDVFFIHSRFYATLPNTCFVLGQTWWDYWLPYRFIMKGWPVFRIMDVLFYHKRHNVQYDAQEWERMTKHFQFVENYPTSNAQKATGSVFNTIMNRSKTI